MGRLSPTNKNRGKRKKFVWTDEIIKYIEEKIMDDFLENSIKVQVNKAKKEYVIRKCQRDLEKKILKKYENEQFYDKLYQTLLKNDNLNRILKETYDLQFDAKEKNKENANEELIETILEENQSDTYNYSLLRDAVKDIMQQSAIVCKNNRNCIKKQMVSLTLMLIFFRCNPKSVRS